MTKYTVRVELHDAERRDYEKLHAEMLKRDFANTIRSSDGETYELPPAEYNLEGEPTRSQVLDRAKSAAEQTRLKYAILVTESAGRTWHGLKQLQLR